MSNKKVGDLRPSQLLYTFGVGAMVDLPHLSALIMGLDDWRTDYAVEIAEERLLAAVKLRLGAQVKRLMLPPIDPNEGANLTIDHRVGVPVVPFPQWGRCPRCDLLAPLSQGLFEPRSDRYHPDSVRFVHSNCPKGVEPTVLPVRFVVGCRGGHLSDFPWEEYIRAVGCACSPSILRLREFGASGDVSDIVLSCEKCKAQRRMGDALGPDAAASLPRCRGFHPHLRAYSAEECPEPVKTLLLGSSNSWFAITLPALSIPASSVRLDQMVAEKWAVLEKAASPEILAAFRAVGNLPEFAEFADGELWEAIGRKRSTLTAGGAEASGDLKTPEWEIFVFGGAGLSSDDLKLRVVDPPVGFAKQIEKVVLVEKLREVRALLGFTRVESPGDFAETEEMPKERIAPLSRNDPQWTPAAEVRGEGILLKFNEPALQSWEQSREVRAHEAKFFTAHKRWRESRKIKPADGCFPGIRFVLLHSFAHALMRRLAIDCGYTAASVRERIYSRSPSDSKGPMAGVLIYTAAADSEGTLGGLVALGEPEALGRHLESALASIELCASDPLCAEHDPAESAGINGAACHACLFAPETSCERGNKYLDRSILTLTFFADNLTFFDQRRS